jgi:hypothetical protein
LDDSAVSPVEPLVDCTGVVETALVAALKLAAEAKQWDIVGRLADELQARRVMRRPHGDPDSNSASQPASREHLPARKPATG